MALKPGSAEHRRFYAQFAKLAYDPPTRMQLPPGWTSDEALSNRNRRVFVNEQDRQVVMAYRGTQPTSKYGAADLGTDLLLALNMREFSSRFRNAQKAAKQTRAKYAEYDMVLTGHSLGGSSAQWAYNKLGKDPKVTAVTFAGHTPTTDIQRQALETIFGDKQRSRGITNYTIPVDPISTGTWLSSRGYTVQQSANSPHALDNYLA